jgi:thymidylate synthase ThyX
MNEQNLVPNSARTPTQRRENARKAGKASAEAKVKSLQSKERKLGSKMAEYAEYALPSYTGKDKQAKSARYYKYQREFNAVRRERNDLQNKISKAKQEARENEAKAKKKFVNSFGEATKRNITNATYEKAQRKLAKDIMRFIGG